MTHVEFALALPNGMVTGMSGRRSGGLVVRNDMYRYFRWMDRHPEQHQADATLRELLEISRCLRQEDNTPAGYINRSLRQNKEGEASIERGLRELRIHFRAPGIALTACSLNNPVANLTLSIPISPINSI
jgi:hypothetical protein